MLAAPDAGRGGAGPGAGRERHEGGSELWSVWGGGDGPVPVSALLRGLVRGETGRGERVWGEGARGGRPIAGGAPPGPDGSRVPAAAPCRAAGSTEPGAAVTGMGTGLRRSRSRAGLRRGWQSPEGPAGPGSGQVRGWGIFRGG